MKRRTIYILLIIASFLIITGLIIWNQPQVQDNTSYYYTKYDTVQEKKNYYTKQQSDYIESFFIQCSLVNSQVVSFLDTQQQPTFVYKNEKCWIYSLTSDKFVIKKESICFESSREEVEKLAIELGNFSLDILENVK